MRADVLERTFGLVFFAFLGFFQPRGWDSTLCIVDSFALFDMGNEAARKAWVCSEKCMGHRPRSQRQKNRRSSLGKRSFKEVQAPGLSSNIDQGPPTQTHLAFGVQVKTDHHTFCQKPEKLQKYPAICSHICEKAGLSIIPFLLASALAGDLGATSWIQLFPPSPLFFSPGPVWVVPIAEATPRSWASTPWRPPAPSSSSAS